ncbi:hypothetical protein VNO80_05767 [Phaseolus coccineus]|uniref:Uncharacterized protein n=1 Tax=Phaseolus coccineus TaxID=3886 RepID=A0AAN9NFP5_PHACN
MLGRYRADAEFMLDLLYFFVGKPRPFLFISGRGIKITMIAFFLYRPNANPLDAFPRLIAHEPQDVSTAVESSKHCEISLGCSFQIFDKIGSSTTLFVLIHSVVLEETAKGDGDSTVLSRKLAASVALPLVSKEKKRASLSMEANKRKEAGKVFFPNGGKAVKCNEDRTRKERERDKENVYGLVEEDAEYKHNRRKEKEE